MAGPPPTVPHPFHPHRKLVDQPGRALVLLPDNRSAPTRRVQERPSSGERHPRVGEAVERRPQAVRVEEDGRGDPDLTQPIYLTDFRCRTLAGLSLVAAYRPGQALRLHDVIRAYLRTATRDRLPALNAALVDAARALLPTVSPGEPDGPAAWWL